MKILYDHQIFELQKFGGISRYFSELFFHIGKEIPAHSSILFHKNQYLFEKFPEKFPISDFQENEPLKSIHFKGKKYALRRLNKLIPGLSKNYYQKNKQNSIACITEGNFDLLHPTYYDPYFLNYINNKPFIITIHDLSYEIYPEFFNLSEFSKYNARYLAQKANHIIAISNKTKNDIINYYQIKEDKITVVYHGVNKPENHKKNNSGPDNYFLYVGERKGYKNFYFLLSSISSLLKQHNIKIICTGMPFTQEELSYFDYLGLTKLINYIQADENTLNNLYKNALAFLYPSLNEGFGIPVLEAFANQCPVILSDIECFREIAGNAALYFNPKNKNEILDKASFFIKNESLRSGYIKLGTKQLEAFSWPKTANETIKVYEKILA